MTTADTPYITPVFYQPIRILIELGQDMLGRIKGALHYNDASYLPKRFAKNPQTAEQRVARAVKWLAALALILAGDRFYQTPFRFKQLRLKSFPPLKNALRIQAGLAPNPPTTQKQRDAAHLRYIQHVFATQPVSKIAERLARRIGLRETSEYWPTALLAIHQTPAAYAASLATPPAAPAEPAPPNPTPNPIPTSIPTPPPPYHQRE